MLKMQYVYSSRFPTNESPDNPLPFGSYPITYLLLIMEYFYQGLGLIVFGIGVMFFAAALEITQESLKKICPSLTEKEAKLMAMQFFLYGTLFGVIFTQF